MSSLHMFQIGPVSYATVNNNQRQKKGVVVASRVMRSTHKSWRAPIIPSTHASSTEKCNQPQTGWWVCVVAFLPWSAVCSDCSSRSPPIRLGTEDSHPIDLLHLSHTRTHPPRVFSGICLFKSRPATQIDSLSGRPVPLFSPSFPAELTSYLLLCYIAIVAFIRLHSQEYWWEVF